MREIKLRGRATIRPTSAEILEGRVAQLAEQLTLNQ